MLYHRTRRDFFPSFSPIMIIQKLRPTKALCRKIYMQNTHSSDEAALYRQQFYEIPEQKNTIQLRPLSIAKYL